MPRVFYNGNGNTGGSVPTDNTVYNNGDSVTVLDNTGTLVKNADVFAYWNTAADGTGTVRGAGAKFNIGASDVTLNAQWYTTSGLTGGGHTTHYQFSYDSVLATAALGNIEPARTNQLIAQCEADFSWMKNLFNNIELPYPYPVSILVANLGGGASWGPPITLKGSSNGKDYLRDLMVAEVTEMFMYQQNLLNLPNHGYGFNGVNDEESNGEGLSHYLNEQFEIRDGRPPGLAFNASLWLNSSLPSGTAGSTRFSGDTPPYDYGARFDYVNTTINDNRNTPASGCSVLFLWYLTVQLGFSAAEICQAASPTLAGVYKNLTGDNGDPFPFFKALLDNRFPSNVVSSVPGPNPDSPFPLAMLSFLVDKSTFGRDEVLDVINTQGGRFQNAFWLVIEGFNADTYLSILPAISTFTGSFANFIGASNFVHSGVYVDYENDANPKIPQRIRLSYDIIFTNTVLNNFPAPGSNPVQMELDTSVTINGAVITGSSASTVFELVGGADPYFTNVNPLQGNEPWLSQDLRLITVTPGINRSPFGSAGTPPSLNTADTTNLDTGAGFQYAQNLITYLNANYSDPTGADPFTLPAVDASFTDASSVARFTLNTSFPFVPLIFQNYNFAIARVRLRGPAGPAGSAQNVKVFFRLWETQTADTNFEPDTYPSTTNAANRPENPLPGSGNHTIPFFATGNNSAALDYQAGSNINKRLIQINSGDSVWAYFVCYLNLYDNSNMVNGQSVSNNWAIGTHHCLVAEIAYDDAPIINTGIVKNPENSDKLAQRNLQLTFSDNPGIQATHRIPQTFEIKPSLTVFDSLGTLINYPDELMIDWKGVPEGSTANIYWPQVNAAEVLDLANKLYAAHLLTATDTHTIQCKTTKGCTFIPVPASAGENFAGLFTIDLPLGVTAGQEFNVLVRKVSSRRRVSEIKNQLQRNKDQSPVVKTDTDFDEDVKPVFISTAASREIKNWRYIAGTFQVRIPVTTKETMLWPEENILAIMKARLQTMSPANKWYPVLVRYIAYISARVDGLGGNSESIKPSFEGAVPVKQDKPCKPSEEKKYCSPAYFDNRWCRLAVAIFGLILIFMFILILILILKK